VTIGLLHHDTDIVFGPALNRAYVLESQQAQYPRIIIDPQAPELLECRRDFIDIDNDWQKLVAASNAPAPAVFPDADRESLRQILYAENAPANLPHGEYHRLYDVATSQNHDRVSCVQSENGRRREVHVDIGLARGQGRLDPFAPLLLDVVHLREPLGSQELFGDKLGG